ncbi:hypothetical protein J2T55_001033 [Methylohalomonas lacus]|uniref:Uncharacterized protein n=1 Tax=Methylohalomonas lacus TaxID=398773 RepID=A0AAE3HKW1_9GAMM|nr:hypothetical protein [Methylohalomonas lacus]MCS3903016.1 hypothetical protein [Methylohalomonas lacus]
MFKTAPAVQEIAVAGVCGNNQAYREYVCIPAQKSMRNANGVAIPDRTPGEYEIIPETVRPEHD